MNGTKATILECFAKKKFPVPALEYFSVREWDDDTAAIVQRVMASQCAKSGLLAVRSSAMAEDGNESSLAGVFHSELNVPTADANALRRAIEEVRSHLREKDDQILVQEMVRDVIMAGVLVSHTLSDGSPYYAVNYDDMSGRTDTITGGKGTGKTVYIYRGVKKEYFDSPRLRSVIELAQRVEREFGDIPIDMEFAVDSRGQVYLLQARRICSVSQWRQGNGREVNEHIAHIAEFIRSSLTPRRDMYGRRTILGVMPDWNPAEMIGIAPRPLALSLYREQITRRVWSLAREIMGYRKMPPVELMLSVGGRPYIDVRASFNSLLPEGLSENLSERLVEAWLTKLDADPSLHDKMEFEIVHTVAEPGFADSFGNRYPGLLSDVELAEYQTRLTLLTYEAFRTNGSLKRSLDTIDQLRRRQERDLLVERRTTRAMPPFDVVICIANALEICRDLGTLPFAIVARHAFMVESVLRAACRMGGIKPERVMEYKRGVKTVSGELTRDFRLVLNGLMEREDFLRVYGHLRPGTYDILSPSYRDRHDLFEASPASIPEHVETGAFSLRHDERTALDSLLANADLGLDAGRFLEHAAVAIAGREYAKFIFSRHISHILELIAIWGEKLSLTREDLSMLSLEDILDTLYKPLPLDGTEHFKRLIEIHREEYQRGRSFELSYLIRSERDVYVVPQHRSAPNFITSKRIVAPVAYLDTGASVTTVLTGHIVCIESADPGYDWIFTRNIAGLLTRYGGANSHMAIRCAEYGLPAAIGCGELIFERVRKASSCLLDCGAKIARPLDGGRGGDICGEWA